MNEDTAGWPQRRRLRTLRLLADPVNVDIMIVLEGTNRRAWLEYNVSESEVDDELEL